MCKQSLFNFLTWRSTLDKIKDLRPSPGWSFSVLVKQKNRYLEFFSESFFFFYKSNNKPKDRIFLIKLKIMICLFHQNGKRPFWKFIYFIQSWPSHVKKLKRDGCMLHTNSKLYKNLKGWKTEYLIAQVRISAKIVLTQNYQTQKCPQGKPGRIFFLSLKFGHSEKATKIWNNLPLDLTFNK